MPKRIAMNAMAMDVNKAGVGNYEYNIIKNVQKLPHDFHITIYIDESMTEYFTESENVKFITAGNFRSSKSRIGYELLRFANELNGNEYDLVHFMDYVTPIAKLKSPFIVTIHDISFYLHPKNYTKSSGFVKRALLPNALVKSKKIVTVSEFTKSEILSNFDNVASDKIVAIPLGVNPPVVDLHKNEFIFNKYKIRQPYVLFVGTIEPRKNIITLIKAMEQLWEREPGVTHNLIVLGKYGWMYDSIIEYAKGSKFADRIIFTGYVSDEELPYFYSGADVFAYTSSYEGFGLPPLEAMSYGVPVVSSDAASIPEALGSAAMFTHTYDSARFSKLIGEIITNRDIHGEYSKKGLEHSKKRSWAATAAGLLEVYKKETEK